MPVSYEQALADSVAYFGGDELAGKVFVDKYALRDADDAFLESTPADMHRRIAREIARVENGKFKEPLSEDQVYSLLENFERIIPQGSPMFGIGNEHTFSSLSNCFIIDSPLDLYGDIMRADEELVQISKRRGGVGVDLSNLRPAGTPTRNAARSSTGVVTFMERYSASIREVGQANRRGALMETLDVHHPEIVGFATAKRDLTKITGANISVKLRDAFLTAVERGEEYEQRWPLEGEAKISRMVDARSVWRTIIESAHATAEPGLLFWDTVLRESPADCYEHFKTVTTNPCCFSTYDEVMVTTLRGDVEIKGVTSDDFVLVPTLDGGPVWARTSGYFAAGRHPLRLVEFSDGTSFAVTGNHKFQRVDGRLVEAVDLGPDDRINSKNGPVSVRSVCTYGEGEVGCIEVDHYHCFYANGIASGNSELPLSPNDSCRLLLLNLYHYVNDPFTPEAAFDFKRFREDGVLAQRIMDDIVDLEAEAIGRIIAKVESDPEPAEAKAVELRLWHKVLDSCLRGRRTGTGITALGDTIAALNVRYGSEESIEVTEAIYRELKHACYRSSVEMAKEIGPFPEWDPALETECPFLLRIKDEDAVLYGDMQKHGRRNIALLTTAPAGSVSLLTKTSSGIEPVFMTGYTRRKKINPDDVNSRVDFVDPKGDRWQEFTVFHPKLKTWMEVTGKTDQKESPYHLATAEQIDWKNRVLLQAAAGKHVDHSISATINLPNDVSVEQVAEIYETAWKAQIKGITVYRSGCRDGVMVEKKTEGTSALIKTNANKRPPALSADVYHVVSGGKKMTMVVGLIDKCPYEVFGLECVLPRSFSEGSMVKVKKGRYDLLNSKGDLVLESANDYCTDEQEALFRMVSMTLRHGAEIKHVVDVLEHVPGSLHSIAKTLVKVLKKYIPDGSSVKEDCGECRRKSLVREEGCVKCVSCGWSRC